MSRYEAWVDGELVGISEYLLTDDVVTITHVQVDPLRRHHGIGATLVRQSLDDVRSSGERKVRPLCSFARAFIRDNPEYQGLVSDRQ